MSQLGDERVARHLKAFRAPQAMRSTRAHGVTPTRQDDAYPAVPVARVLRREDAHRRASGRTLLRLLRFLTPGRVRHAEDGARAAKRETSLAGVLHPAGALRIRSPFSRRDFFHDLDGPLALREQFLQPIVLERTQPLRLIDVHSRRVSARGTPSAR
jgi:hypothetical protein